MKMNVIDVKAITLDLRLIAPEEYYKVLELKPEIIDQVANGVGSETSITYHLTPDTVWGMNINPVSHIHDWMYTLPLSFKSVADGLAYKRLADHWFYVNGMKMVTNGSSWLQGVRTKRFDAYAVALNAGGSEAFWCNKVLPPDYEHYYIGHPPKDAIEMQRLIEINYQVMELKP